MTRFLILLFALAAWAPAQSESAVEQQMVRLLNQERAKAGLPQLRTDPQLTDAARAHSRLLAEHHALSHEFAGEPDLSQRVAAAGLRFNAVAENVAFTDEPDPAASMHTGLMHSPPHRANILGPNYNAVGVAVVRRGRAWYATEDFARTFAAVSADQVANTVADAIARLRARDHLPPLPVQRDPKLDRLACARDSTVHTLLSQFPDSRSTVVFTTWTPEQLPSQMISTAQSKALKAVALRACPLPAAEGGAGGFKIAAVFF